MHVQALGWTLLHFAWQGTAAAAVLAFANILLRRAAPQVRYALASATLFLMALMVVSTYRVVRCAQTPSTPPPCPSPTYAGRGRAETAIGSAIEGAAANVAARPGVASVSEKDVGGRDGFGAGVRRETPTGRDTDEVALLRARVEPALPILVGLWGAGVLLLSLRSCGGWVLVQRLKRSGRQVSRNLEEMAERLVDVLEVWAPVRLLDSALVDVPTVIGWLRPVVLLPASAVTGLSPQQLELILVHELAHIRRADYLVNLLQTAVETLLFYHPAVWWVSHRIRMEREHCCDDVAVATCGNAVVYARALADLESRRLGQPAFAVGVNGGSLLARVSRLVASAQHPSCSSRGLAALLAVVALGAAVVAVSLLPAGLVSATPSAARAAEPPSGSEVGAAAHEKPWTRGSAFDSRPVPRGTSAPSVVEPNPDASGSIEPRVAGSGEDPGEGSEPETHPQPALAGSPADRSFSLPQILEMSRHGVTPEWISEMAAVGYSSLTVPQIVELRSHGVGPVYVRGLAEQGYRDIAPDRLVELRSHGVTPSYVRELKVEGLADLTLSDLVQLRSHGVTPEYLAELREAGYDDLSVSQSLALRNQGVTGSFVAELKRLGYAELDSARLIALRAQGVTPEYVKELKDAGLDGLAVGVLIELRAHGVTGGFVREMKKAGHDKATPEELIELRSHGWWSRKRSGGR